MGKASSALAAYHARLAATLAAAAAAGGQALNSGPAPEYAEILAQARKTAEAKAAEDKAARDARQELAKKKRQEDEDLHNAGANRHVVEDMAAAEEEDEDPATNVYAEYTPAKMDDGHNHPDPVVETASLANIVPPDVHYEHHLQSAVSQGTLSSLQIESICYAWQRFEGPRMPPKMAPGAGEDPSPHPPPSRWARHGFFLGDGAGVGKGRQIAGCIHEHFKCGGKRVLWVSVSNDLKWDAERDLKDLGMDEIPVFPKGTQSLPTHSLVRRSGGVPDGVLFVTYSLLIHGGVNGNRLDHFIEWLAEDEAPLIILDECHKAKNLMPSSGKPTKTALEVVRLQEALPDARVLYCSATGASDPSTLAYMVRLGSFGFASLASLLSNIQDAGFGASEVFAMGLKSLGAYTCRTLSYKGAEFNVKNIKVGSEFSQMFDLSAQFWQLLYNTITKAGQCGVDMPKKLWAQFWAAHQRFFRQMLISGKVPHLSRLVAETVYRDGNCAVIGLQSTGEASTNKKLEEAPEHDDFVSAPALILENLVKKQFPVYAPAEADPARVQQLEDLYEAAVRCVYSWMKSDTIAQRTGAGGDDLTMDEDDDDEVEVIEDLSSEEKEKRKWEVAALSGAIIDVDAIPARSPRGLFGRNMASSAALASGMFGSSSGTAAPAIASDKSTPTREEIEGIEAEVFGDAHFEEVRRRRQEGTERFDRQREKLAKLMPSEEPAASPSEEADSDDDDFETPPRAHRGNRRRGKRAVSVSESEEEIIYSDGEGPSPAGEDEDEEMATPAPATTASGRPARAGRKRYSSLNEDKSDSDGETEMDEGGDDEDDEEDFEEGDEEGDEDFEERPPLTGSKPLARRASGGAGRNQSKRVRLVEPSALSGQAARRAALQGLASKVKVEGGATASAGGGTRRTRARAAKREDDDDYEEMGTSSEEDYDDDSGSDTPSERGGHAHWMGEDEPESYTTPVVVGKKGFKKGGVLMRKSQRLVKLRGLLLKCVELLELPPNPLDHLTDLLGGPSKVAEMTGRQGHFCRQESGTISYQTRRPGTSQKMTNMGERDDFMQGRKLVAIISEAASCGISLQADKRVANQRRRVHFTLELPWSAEKAIQQFGRSHRSNQASAPIYRILVTEVGGERRFASSAAKRLSQLGAILQGDRRAMGAGQELKNFDVDNSYGKEALNKFLGCIVFKRAPVAGVDLPAIELPGDPEEGPRPCCIEHADSTKEEHPKDCKTTSCPKCFSEWANKLLQGVGMGADLEDVRKAEYSHRTTKPFPVRVDKFLNRILGLPIKQQNTLFEHFFSWFYAIIRHHKSKGSFDGGIVELKGESITVEEGYPQTMHTCEVTGAITDVTKLMINRGITFEQAQVKLEEINALDENVSPNNGFWIATFNKNFMGSGQPLVQIITRINSANRVASRRGDPSHTMFRRILPHNSVAPPHPLSQITKNYRKVTAAEAKELWDFWYERTGLGGCLHGKDTCSLREEHGKCSHGARHTPVFLVSGAVLPVWKLLSATCQKFVSDRETGGKKALSTLRIARAHATDVTGLERRYVGLSLGEAEVQKVLEMIENDRQGAEAGGIGSDYDPDEDEDMGRGENRGWRDWSEM